MDRVVDGADLTWESDEEGLADDESESGTDHVALSILSSDFDLGKSGKQLAERSHLEWREVSYSVKSREKGAADKVILSGVSGSLQSGEVLALLGGSGSGKTTLLGSLSGRLPEGVVEGTVLFNRKQRDTAMWPRTYGFVECHDAFFAVLTVREVLTYSAKFKIRGATDQERRQRAQQVAEELGLLRCLDTVVGSIEQEIKGISSGERKRLSIAIELLGCPAVLFLDEPTSGLDSFIALNTIEYVRNVAALGGQMVILSLHQPRENMLLLFDKIMILSRGRTVYFGSPLEAEYYFASVGFPTPEKKINPADWWLDIATFDSRSRVRQRDSRKRIKRLHNEWRERESQVSVTVADDLTDNVNAVTPDAASSISRSDGAALGEFALPIAQEFRELLHLSFLLIVKDWVMMLSKFAGVFVPLLLYSVIFWRLDKSTLDGVASLMGFIFVYQLVLAFAFSTDPISVFYMNKLVLKRERGASMYRSASLFLATWGALMPYYACFHLVEALVLWGTVGLNNPLMFFSTTVVYMGYWTAIGLAIGAISPKVEVGILLAAIQMIIVMCFSGYFASVQKNIPWVRYLDPAQYAICMYGQSEMGSNFPPASQGSGASLNPDFCIFKNYWQNFAGASAFMVMGVCVGAYALYAGTRTRHILS